MSDNRSVLTVTDAQGKWSGVVKEPDGDTRWLALVLAEMLRTGLALIAKKYPEARGKHVCGKCGHRG